MNINWYGFFIALGVLVGTLVAEKIRKTSSYFSQLKASVYDFFPWLLIGGVVGARLYHVINFLDYYLTDPKLILCLWCGGLGIYGGIIGGVIGIYIFLKLKTPACAEASAGRQNSKLKTTTQNSKLNNLLLILDLVVVGLPLGQAIGRWGNFFNQELYGWPTSLPWGIFINPENRLPGWENFSRFHPIFLYESLWCLVIFLIILRVLFSATNCDPVRPGRTLSNSLPQRTKKNIDNHYFFPGRIFFLYLFLYSLGRFWLEFLRIDTWLAGGVRVNQLLAVILMVLSVVAICRKNVTIKI